MTVRSICCLLLGFLLSSCGPCPAETPEQPGPLPQANLPGSQPSLGPTVTAPFIGKSIEVPLGPAPTIDGTLSDAAWEGAYVETMLAGGEIYFLQDGHDLFVGLDAGVGGMGSLCVNWGDRVEVLHSSAALGGRYYQHAVDDWSLVEETDWCCRGGRADEAAETEWQAQLDSYGWVSSLYNMGTRTQIEYQIGLRDQPVRLAAVFMSMAGTIHAWPPDLSDDCLDRDLISEDTPETIQFEPRTWPQLNMK
ncbi:MAG: hypothetical protein E4G99_04655 [Anaerolineales bacterium]|nr:MAG: hypothetical protein E4G99_04655 [Anaerolineales bacterium]